MNSMKQNMLFKYLDDAEMFIQLLIMTLFI